MENLLKNAETPSASVPKKKKARRPALPEKSVVKALKVPKMIADKSKAFKFEHDEDLFSVRDAQARLSSKDYMKVIPNRYVGIEIELSNAGLNKATSAEWKDLASYCSAVKTDGSVDGDGMELNTIPARGLAFHKQVEVVGASLKSLKAKANRSCGLHVHIDAADFAGIDTYKLALLWAKIEDLVFNTLPISRRTNTYCAKYDERTRQAILTSKYKLADVTPQQVMRRFNLGDKYKGLNFGSFHRLQTFEFRCHEGTSDGTEMALWGMFAAEIVSFAKRSTISGIRETKFDDLSPIFKDNEVILRYINARTAKAKRVRKAKAFL